MPIPEKKYFVEKKEVLISTFSLLLGLVSAKYILIFSHSQK